VKLSCPAHTAGTVLTGGISLAALLTPTGVFGHGIGERYDLPVPLSLWLTGGGGAIAASFVVTSVVLKSKEARTTTGDASAALRMMVVNPSLSRALQVATFLLALLVVIAGLIGDQTPTYNIAPVMVWVIWWVGMAYLSALVGDIWSIINPWAFVFAGFENFAKQFHLRLHPRRYPDWLGAWPAVILFGAFSWIELVYDSRAEPSRLATLMVGYSIITWVGMMLFGREPWLACADPFAVAFRTFAQFAPIEVRHECELARSIPWRGGMTDQRGGQRAAITGSNVAYGFVIRFRPYGSGLIESKAISPSMLVFISLLLSTVTFDGFLATPAWNALEGYLFRMLSEFPESRVTIITTAGLIAFWTGFLGLYLAFAEWMSRAAQGALSFSAAARLFVIALVPIAIGYNIAHYFTYLLTEGQLVLKLASDPFGFGWNLFGTARYHPNYELVGGRFTWYVAVFAIVIGHIFAVYIAHKIALREIADRDKALRSQVPMLLLMIGYTMLSLWIIAQPVTQFNGG
jgi:hypothetical protein